LDFDHPSTPLANSTPLLIALISFSEDSFVEMQRTDERTGGSRKYAGGPVPLAMQAFPGNRQRIEKRSYNGNLSGKLGDKTPNSERCYCTVVGICGEKEMEKKGERCITAVLYSPSSV